MLYVNAELTNGSRLWLSANLIQYDPNDHSLTINTPMGDMLLVFTTQPVTIGNAAISAHIYSATDQCLYTYNAKD